MIGSPLRTCHGPNNKIAQEKLLATLLNDDTRAGRKADASKTDRNAVATSRASIVVGLGGGRRNPAAAVAVDGRLLAFCEQERLTRIRGGGLRPGELPKEAISTVLGLAGYPPASVSAYVTSEEGLVLPAALPRVRLDHHHGHASTAYLTSPFEKTAVLVCDHHSSPDTSVWMGHGDEVFNQHWPWTGEGFASLLTQCCEIFDIEAGLEHRLEALARLSRPSDAEIERMTQLVSYRDGTLVTAPRWKSALFEWLCENGPEMVYRTWRNGRRGVSIGSRKRLAATLFRTYGARTT